MYETFGAVVDGNTVTFKLFFPDKAVNPAEYSTGGLPNIAKIQMTGDFQSRTGGTDWDNENAPEMTKTGHLAGILYTYEIPSLIDGYYEYKYYVTFQNGETRWCTDPCTKYGGGKDENSAFVIGGHDVDVQPIANRLPQKDLIIYELMPDDFTAEFRNNDAPFDAIKKKLDYLQDLGVNTIEFMPWTAWPGSDFNWGYEVFQFFSVEYRYINDDRNPLDKLYRLKTLINEIHSRDMHVIMDGVFNHARAGEDPGTGFGYYWLYQNPQDSPFIGHFEQHAYFKDLNFANACTRQFILDSCKYWLDVYQVDGIRFDYTVGYYNRGKTEGVTELCHDVHNYCESSGKKNVSLMLEHLTDERFQAITDTNKTDATGCWYDRLMYECQSYVEWNYLDTRFPRALHTSKYFAEGKGPITYIENHDQDSFIRKAGGRELWWKTQPYVIALLTAPGTVLIHNGQEFGEYYEMPGHGPGRVKSRPLDWNNSTDHAGQSLLGLYKTLISIRKTYPSLRSPNYYPDTYLDYPSMGPFDVWDRYFNGEGYGVHVDKKIMIFHRWGKAEDGKTEWFIIVLNFSQFDQYVDIPFSLNGAWRNLLNDTSDDITHYRLYDQRINSNWGKIYYKKEQ